MEKVGRVGTLGRVPEGLTLGGGLVMYCMRGSSGRRRSGRSGRRTRARRRSRRKRKRKRNRKTKVAVWRVETLVILLLILHLCATGRPR
jgi:hypothetical protein